MKARTAAILVMLCALVSVAALLPGCGKAEQSRYESTREMLGTFVSITLFADNEDAADRAGNAAFNRIAEVERLMSSYYEFSKISLLNKFGFWNTKPLAVGDDTLHVLEASVEYSKLSDGAFDVTVAPLIKLWRQAAQEQVLPDEAAIDEALKSVGCQHVQLDADTKTVRFARREMEVDLGGIAKGYAADMALEELRCHGITAALVNAGGDIAVMGKPPGQDAWRVGIQNPGRQNERLPDVIHLADGAVATSGNYERYAEIEGRRFSHIIDPRTGRPVERISSVTVVAADAMRADALATAFSVLGPAASLKLAAQLDDVEAMFIIAPETPGGEPQVVSSEGFSTFFRTANDQE